MLQNKIKISASLMCADPFHIKNAINSLEENGVDYLHIDIMDGHFVYNMGLGIDWIKMIRKHTHLPLDFHLMVENPNRIIPLLDLRENDIICIHYESTYRIEETIHLIKNCKVKFFIAVNPITPICILDQISPYINGINFMTINPGFSGQQILPSSLQKAERLVKYIKQNNLTNTEIEVDGNMNLENIKKFLKYGANIFVLGTSSIFPNNKLNIANLNQVQKIIRNYNK